MVLKHGPKFSDLPIKRSGLKCHLIPLNVWNLKYDTGTYLTRQKQTQNRLVVAKGDGGGEGWTGSLEFTDANLHTEGINNKALLCSTELYSMSRGKP